MTAPSYLLDLKAWLAWRFEIDPDRPGENLKMPYDEPDRPSRRADAQKPGTRLTYTEATAFASRRGYTGVGFCFASEPATDVFCLDLDGCRDSTTGRLAPEAQAVLDLLKTYAEVSPSKEGVKAFFRADKPADGPKKRKWKAAWSPMPGVEKKPGVEFFSRGGYCTVTGDALPGYAELRILSNAEVHQGLALACGAIVSADTDEIGRPVPPPRNEHLSNAEVLARIAEKHPDLYQRWWIAGDRVLADESSEDAKLATVIAIEVGGDIDRIVELMETTGIKREKWTSHRSYLRITATSAATHIGSVVETAPRVLPPLESFGDLRRAAIPEPGWLVEGIWPALARGWIAGEPKLGKSWLAMALAVAIATGTRFLGRFEVKQTGPVMYLTEESSRFKVRERFNILCQGLGIDPARLDDGLFPYVRKGVKLTDPAWLAHLVAEQTRVKPVAVFIDPLRRYHSNPENQAHEMAPVLDAAAAFQDGGSAVPIVHHMRKGGGDPNAPPRPSQMLRGSSDLGAWHDAALYCVGVPQVKERMLVEPEFKDEAARDPFEIVLAYDPPGDVLPKTALALSVGTARSREGMAAQGKVMEVLRWLATQDEPRNTSQVKSGVGGNERATGDALEAAFGNGLVTKNDGGRGSKLWSLTPIGRAKLDGTLAEAPF